MSESFKNIAKFFLLSAIGIFVFFVPVNLGGKNTIPLDHIVSFLKGKFPFSSKYIVFTILFAGSVIPFLNGKWNKTKTDLVMSVLKILGLVFSIMILSGRGFKVVLEPSIGNFLFYKLVVPVGLIVPVGAVFLSFLIDYGLLDFAGVLATPFMKPVFKTPGRSAIDAIASFVGSYSIGLLITDKVFKKGEYSPKEAAIIATGFSTVSATFMIIVCKTLGIMEHWNLYFWTTLFITFTATAMTARIFPIARFSEKKREKEEEIKVSLKGAFKKGIEGAEKSGSVLRNIKQNFLDGLKMASAILPSIMSIGLIGLLLAKYTPFFDVAGYLFYPFTKLLASSEPFLTAKASALSIS